MRSAATVARSSDSRNGVAWWSAYGSKISAYSSNPASRAARPVRSASRARSGSAPISGSQLLGRITSLLAPSCAPASMTWAVSSRSMGTVSSALSPRATAVSPSRKSLALPAIRSASGRQSSAGCADIGPSAPAPCDAPAPFGASDIKQPPSLKCSAQRYLVRVLQLTADRQSASWPGHPDPQRLDHPGQVGRRRLPLKIGVGRQDDLGDRAVRKSGHQLPDPQILRADAVDGTDGTAQYVIAPAELADLLDGRDVLRLLDNADQ